MPRHDDDAARITASIKGLGDHLQENEQPIMAIPAIWDGGQSQRSTPCDVVLTNQRLFGYYLVKRPRERLFLDALSLSKITSFSLRKKSFSPLFQELLVSEGLHRVYIRAPRQKIETLYSALRLAIESYAPEAQASIERESSDLLAFRRQEIRAPFESSPLAITILFVGGLMLEIGGIAMWATTHSSQIGLPICIAGFVAVSAAIWIRRQRQ